MRFLCWTWTCDFATSPGLAHRFVRCKNSGAYVFRPSVPNQGLKTIGYSTAGVKFVNTSVGTEVHLEFEVPWLKQVTRVLQGLPYVEVEYSIGPIPIDDLRGKEVVTRFSTPIKSNQTFYTDSNGREFLERKLDSRPSWPLQVFEPVAGNYYPVNAAIYIEDEASSMAVLVDRTQGGSSLSDGAVELMAQRRILADDARGVNEPMNETDGGVTPYPPYGNAERCGEGMIVRGVYRIMVGGGKRGASLARSEMDSAFASPLVFAASSPATADEPNIQESFSAIQNNLPPNVMLITFKKLAEHAPQYLVRFGHQFGIGDDAILSKPVSIDLSQVFSNLRLVSADELTLSANEKYNDWVKRRVDWLGKGPFPPSMVNGTSTVVTLHPMEVRTFLLVLDPN
jgi:alpha-mannosidase